MLMHPGGRSRCAEASAAVTTQLQPASKPGLTGAGAGAGARGSHDIVHDPVFAGYEIRLGTGAVPECTKPRCHVLVSVDMQNDYCEECLSKTVTKWAGPLQVTDASCDHHHHYHPWLKYNAA